MKKALFFVNSLVGGGAERVCLNLAEELFLEGYKSIFITLYQESCEYKIPEYITLYCLDVKKDTSGLQRAYEIIKKIPKVNLWIKKEQYNLITAHLPMSHLLASLSCVARSTFFVMHNAQWPLDRRQSKIYWLRLHTLYRKFHMISVSEGVRRELIDCYGFPAQQVETIFNPLLLNNFFTVSKESSPHPRPYIISMGRLDFPKRPDIAIELYHKSEISQQFDLVILGEGSMRLALEEKVEEYGLQNVVHFVGFQQNPIPWLQNAKLMLSFSDSEALPMNIIESLACGTGVLAMKCRFGPEEIMIGELADYLIDPINEFNKSIFMLHQALKYYPTIQLSLLERFNASKIVQQYLSCWQKNLVQPKDNR